MLHLLCYIEDCMKLNKLDELKYFENSNHLESNTRNKVLLNVFFFVKYCSLVLY